MQISVVIPTYNRAGFLKQTIDSVLAQSYPAKEIIVVDDGSTDETLSFLENYGNQIRVISLRENRGVSYARNRGITAAKSEYIAFLDSDDHWFPEKLEKQVVFHQNNPRYKLSYTDESWQYNGKKKKKKAHHRKPSGDIFIPSLSRTLIGPSSVIIHQSVFEHVGVFDENLPVCEDYDLWLRITRYYPVGLVDEELIVKIAGHGDQLSFNSPMMDQFRIQSMEKQLDITPPKRDILIKTLIEKCRIIMEGAEKRGQSQTYTLFLKKYEQYVKLTQSLTQESGNES